MWWTKGPARTWSFHLVRGQRKEAPWLGEGELQPLTREGQDPKGVTIPALTMQWYQEIFFEVWIWALNIKTKAETTFYFLPWRNKMCQNHILATSKCVGGRREVPRKHQLPEWLSLLKFTFPLQFGPDYWLSRLREKLFSSHPIVNKHPVSFCDVCAASASQLRWHGKWDRLILNFVFWDRGRLPCRCKK